MPRSICAVSYCPRPGMLQQNFASVLTRELVTPRRARAVAALYDELWDEPPDESTLRARISVSRSRNHAAARDWPVPMAWDEPEIDDPAAGLAESWRGAAGRRSRPPSSLRMPSRPPARRLPVAERAAMRLGVSRDRSEHAYMPTGRRQALGPACTGSRQQRGRGETEQFQRSPDLAAIDERSAESRAE